MSVTIPEELNVEEIQEVGQSIAEYFPYCEEQKQFHLSPKQVRWLLGGNQSGKTFANMMDLALYALEIHPAREPVPNGLHWVGIESWEQVRDILWGEYLSKFIPKWAVTEIWYGQSSVPRKVFFKNGHIIEFKAFNQGRTLFQGRAINSFHGDEQCLHHFKEIFDEIRTRLMKYKGFMSWSMTPIIPQIELESRVENLPRTDDIFFMDLNNNRFSKGGHLPDEEVDKLIEEWPEETLITRQKGKFSSYIGAVFKTYNRQTHMIEPFKIPRGWKRYRGYDFGFTNPFVCLWLAKDPDENWYVYREYYKAQTGIHDHINTVKVLSTGESYIENIADPENAEDRAEMKKHGIATKPARKDVHAGIEVVQSKFKVKANGKPSLYIFSTCKNTLRELPVYRYPQGGSTTNPKDVPLAKDDHTVDALRYVIYTVDGKFRKGSVCTS